MDDLCPQDNPDDSDGDGVCDSDDLCPGGDDTVDLDANGTPDDCDSPDGACAEVLADDPGALSDVYTIDPDGDGGLDPFDVYCDMDTMGGGWTLVMNRTNDQETIKVSGVLTPSDTSQAVDNARWAALRDASTETIAVFDSTVFVASLSDLAAARCTPLATDLSANPIAHDEDAGCDTKGGDYSNWFGIDGGVQDRNTYFWNGSSMPFFITSPTPAAASFVPDEASMYVR